MKTVNISYAVRFGKCDGGDGELSINVSDYDYKWIQIVKKLVEEIDSDEIKEAIIEIKNEIERINSLNKNEEYETQLYLINDDDTITKEELLSVDWDSIDVDKFVGEVFDEVYEYEEECYKELYDYDSDDDDDDDNEYEDDYDGEDGYPGVITQICW